MIVIFALIYMNNYSNENEENGNLPFITLMDRNTEISQIIVSQNEPIGFFVSNFFNLFLNSMKKSHFKFFFVGFKVQPLERRKSIQKIEKDRYSQIFNRSSRRN